MKLLDALKKNGTLSFDPYVFHCHNHLRVLSDPVEGSKSDKTLSRELTRQVAKLCKSLRDFHDLQRARPTFPHNTLKDSAYIADLIEGSCQQLIRKNIFK